VTSAFVERLRQGYLVADGAMGTLLYARGVGFDHCFELLNVEQPDLVRGVHADYVAAGAGLIETNTFGANTLRLAEHGLADRVAELNLAGARLARAAADAVPGTWVAGSVGPLGVRLTPIGHLTLERTSSLSRPCAIWTRR
jgi:methionine synthase / methylenetetrahydrofolate reductase(NADPH)